jgi:anti-anti-sigma regulatory factor
LVLDLADAKRINSAGLSHLVLLVTNANTNSSRVVLAACSPFIAVVLNRSKLDQFFELAENVDEAVARLSGP